MPSEKMRYILRRLEEKPRTDIELTPLKTEIEAVFNKRNLDQDCNTISSLLSPYEETLREYLNTGNYADAITLLFEVLESLTYHFVEDEHYAYFDDMYSPDYECDEMIEKLIKTIQDGKVPADELKRWEDGMERLVQTESYKEYGYPSALYLWEKHRKNNQNQ